jgi:hypothetical protein
LMRSRLKPGIWPLQIFKCQLKAHDFPDRLL